MEWYTIGTSLSSRDGHLVSSRLARRGRPILVVEYTRHAVPRNLIIILRPLLDKQMELLQFFLMIFNRLKYVIVFKYPCKKKFQINRRKMIKRINLDQIYQNIGNSYEYQIEIISKINLLFVFHIEKIFWLRRRKKKTYFPKPNRKILAQNVHLTNDNAYKSFHSFCFGWNMVMDKNDLLY